MLIKEEAGTVSDRSVLKTKKRRCKGQGERYFQISEGTPRRQLQGPEAEDQWTEILRR